MSNINLESRDHVAVVRLNNGVTNAINSQLVNDLSDVLKQVKDEYRGMVFCGGEKFFCIGLDLPELIKLDRKGMTDFINKFTDACVNLYTLPVPTACAINGHAVAGGCILTLTCDYRIAALEKIKIGMNEIKLGIPAPYLVDMVLRQLIGDRATVEMLYPGEFLSTTEAKDIGLVDEIVSDGSVEDLAIEKITELAGLPSPAFSAIKTNRVEQIQQAYEKNNKAKNEVFLDCWFSKPVQELLIEASEKF